MSSLHPRFYPIFAVIILCLAVPCRSWGAFYQADTMAENCREYTKFIELKSPVKQLEAGVCSGYIASTIELMDLSGRLCERENINLDHVVKQYIEHIENNLEAAKYTATYVIVDLLQQNYACKNSDGNS